MPEWVLPVATWARQALRTGVCRERSRAEGEGHDDRATMSRVLLIRLPAGEGGEVTCYDLTREVAEQFPALGGRKRWRGVFSVYRTVSG